MFRRETTKKDKISCKLHKVTKLILFIPVKLNYGNYLKLRTNKKQECKTRVSQSTMERYDDCHAVFLGFTGHEGGLPFVIYVKYLSIVYSYSTLLFLQMVIVIVFGYNLFTFCSRKVVW